MTKAGMELIELMFLTMEQIHAQLFTSLEQKPRTCPFVHVHISTVFKILHNVILWLPLFLRPIQYMFFNIAIVQLWMRWSRVVRASDCQCQSRYSPRFNPSILYNTIEFECLQIKLNLIKYLTMFPLKQLDNTYCWANSLHIILLSEYNTLFSL